MKTVYLLAVFTFSCVILFSKAYADDTSDMFHLTPLEQNKKPFLNFAADGQVDTVKISGNDRYVAAGTQAGDKKGSVYFFDNNGTLLWKYIADRQILQVAVSSDGKYLAAAGSQFYHYGTYGPAGWNNGEVYYFDEKGNLLWKYDGTGSVAVTNIAISSDGSYVAVGSDKAILYFDKNGNLLWTYPVTRSNDHTVSISPDGSYVVTKDEAVVEFLDNHGNQIWSYTAGHGTEENVSAGSSYLTMSPDGRYVITSDYADGILLFDDAGKIVLAKNTGKHFFYQSISYDGSFIAASAQQWGDSDPGATYLFDKNGTILWSYPGDMRSVVSGDGRYVLGGIWNSGLALFFLDDKGNLLWNSNAGNVNSLDISYDGTLSVAGTGFGNDNGYILFFNQNKTDVVESQPIAITQVELDSPLAFFPDNQTCYDKPGFVSSYTCSTTIVPGKKVQCAYFIGSSTCEPIHQYTGGTTHTCLDPNEVPKAPQWFDMYNTENKTIQVLLFSVQTLQNMKSWGYQSYVPTPITLAPHEKCTYGFGPVDEPLALEQANMSFAVTYDYEGKNYTATTSPLTDLYNDDATWQLVGDQWIFAQQNTSTIPEFPVVIPILLISITSIIIFHRMKFRK